MMNVYMDPFVHRLLPSHLELPPVQVDVVLLKRRTQLRVGQRAAPCHVF